MSTFAELSPEEQATRLHHLAQAAVSRWPLDCVRIEAIKVRENAVYAVHTADRQRVVLRVHRLGYHSDEALHSELTLKDGRIEQSNLHNFPVLRLNEMPVVDVHIVPSTDKMGGCGEPGVPPTAPAVANAVFAATGKRLRQLPLRLA